jgi:hypothetical protein
LPETGQSIGINVGLATFAALSDGQEIANPRSFLREERELAKVQRPHSKEEKGTAALGASWWRGSTNALRGDAATLRISAAAVSGATVI